MYPSWLSLTNSPGSTSESQTLGNGMPALINNRGQQQAGETSGLQIACLFISTGSQRLIEVSESAQLICPARLEVLCEAVQSNLDGDRLWMWGTGLLRVLPQSIIRV